MNDFNNENSSVHTRFVFMVGHMGDCMIFFKFSHSILMFIDMGFYYFSIYEMYFVNKM